MTNEVISSTKHWRDAEGRIRNPGNPVSKTVKKTYSEVSFSSQISSWKKQTSELIKTGVDWISPPRTNCSSQLLGQRRCLLLVGPESGRGTSVCCRWVVVED